MVSLHCTLPCELRSGDFLEPGKPADLWECSLGFSKNSEVFLVGKTTLSINSCAHYFTRVNHTSGVSVALKMAMGSVWFVLCEAMQCIYNGACANHKLPKLAGS